MHDQFGESSLIGDRRLERAIVLHLLGEDRDRRLSREGLAAALGRDALALQPALERLADAGVVCLEGDDVRASAATRRIDELGLIGI
jgi:predicted transcriptional regulator